VLLFDLDKLGWHDFESLIQALLKVTVGVGVEAWGGHHDYGRDAYFDGSLRYPTTALSRGPFLFQCKFVEGANAAGSDAFGRLEEACRQEAERVEFRLLPAKHPRSLHRTWDTAPRHYILYTNASLTGPRRSKIRQVLANTLPKARVSIHDGRDICASLASQPNLTRTFPQLLGLRDLGGLISMWARKDITLRSELAIAHAKDLRPVFVPTNAYFQALAKLQEHHFVVLEGPPEMGKTAIGRIIGLTQLVRGWQAIECRSPEDLLHRYESSIPQVFIADDFFGRTEYDPSRISKWQDDLPHALRLLDQKHWLILTTRAHLLNMARTTLDVAGHNREFPTLAEVVVDAGKLSEIEKGRILYRHAKRLGAKGRQAIKFAAESIVENPHFTPERIRRLHLAVEDAATKGTLTRSEVARLVRDELDHPTEAMRASFQGLREAHKWLLFAMVEGDRYLSPFRSWEAGSDLQRRFERLCPAEELEDFRGAADEMSEAFVKRDKATSTRYHLDWIHPSCRDLAIEELRLRPRYRRRFLETCDSEGIRLATSIGGGPIGDLNFPLLDSSTDIGIFRERACELIASDITIADIVRSNLATARQNGAISFPFDEILKVFREDLLPRWNEGIRRREQTPAGTVAAITEASALTGDSVDIPDIQRMVQRQSNIICSTMQSAEKLSHVVDGIEQFIDLCKVSRHTDSEIRASVNRQIDDAATKIILGVRSWLAEHPELTDAEQEEAWTLYREYSRLATQMKALAKFVKRTTTKRGLKECAGQVDSRGSTIAEFDSAEDDESVQEPPVFESETISVATLFEDL
jgi:hypothetical protein